MAFSNWFDYKHRIIRDRAWIFRTLRNMNFSVYLSLSCAQKSRMVKRERYSYNRIRLGTSISYFLSRSSSTKISLYIGMPYKTWTNIRTSLNLLLTLSFKIKYLLALFYRHVANLLSRIVGKTQALGGLHVSQLDAGNDNLSTGKS
jgi:hypothetical protein